MVVLDTNIIIDHLRLPQGSETSFTKIAKFKPDESFAVSVISVQELYQGKSSMNLKSEEEIINMLSVLHILPYEFKAAKLAGEIVRDSSPPVQFADAAIAATALINGAQLFTLNKKDFSGVKDLELL